MTAELTVAAVLAILQVLVLRASQYAFPNLYFTSAWLFDRRSELTVGALIFRLAIPFSAGLLVPLMLSDNQKLIAGASGAVAWFLVLWPILWAPSVMLPSGWEWPLGVVLLAFWPAFCGLAIAGASVTEALQQLSADHHIDWGTEVSVAFVLVIPTTVCIAFLGRIARARLSFRDDPYEPPEWEEEEEDSDDSVAARLSALEPGQIVALATAALVAAAILFRRLSRAGR